MRGTRPRLPPARHRAVEACAPGDSPGALQPVHRGPVHRGPVHRGPCTAACAPRACAPRACAPRPVYCGLCTAACTTGVRDCGLCIARAFAANVAYVLHGHNMWCHVLHELRIARVCAASLCIARGPVYCGLCIAAYVARTNALQPVYSKGKPGASSRNSGAVLSRAETIRSDSGSGQLTATSGSFHAMPSSIAGS